MKEFEFHQPAEGLFILAFPDSEQWCCDGEWLTGDDLRALQAEITKLLAVEDAKSRAEKQHG